MFFLESAFEVGLHDRVRWLLYLFHRSYLSPSKFCITFRPHNYYESPRLAASACFIVEVCNHCILMIVSRSAEGEEREREVLVEKLVMMN